MTGLWICVRMQLWKVSKHSRVQSIPGFCIYASTAQGSEYAWIIMPEYGWIIPYGRVLNMPGQRFTGF